MKGHFLHRISVTIEPFTYPNDQMPPDQMIIHTIVSVDGQELSSQKILYCDDFHSRFNRMFRSIQEEIEEFVAKLDEKDAAKPQKEE